MSAMALYDDMNPDWEESVTALPGWEPWEPDEDEDMHAGGCEYCGAPDVRDTPEPFGGKPCCDACFVLIVGGVDGEPPWRCGNAGR